MISYSSSNRDDGKATRDQSYLRQEDMNEQNYRIYTNQNQQQGQAAYVVSPPSSQDLEYGEVSGYSAYKDDYVDQMELIVRHGFIRKVMAVVFVQLLVTFGVILLFNMNDKVKDYMDIQTGNGLAFFWTSFVISMICIIALSCCANQARTHPNNVIFLSIFTLAESVLLGIACAAYDIDAILIAVGATSLIVFGLILFASQTSADFTGLGPYLFMSLWGLMIYGLIFLFVDSEVADMLYSIIGVILFSFYLVYDVQLIVGGKHNRFRFSIDEWVFASLNVYLDIINLFIRVLELVSKLQKDR